MTHEQRALKLCACALEQSLDLATKNVPLEAIPNITSLLI